VLLFAQKVLFFLQKVGVTLFKSFDKLQTNLNSNQI
jgi:hypothetical protein